jgi:soluble calcium-activated nucleotidase 1
VTDSKRGNYRIAILTDLDKRSFMGNAAKPQFQAYLQLGNFELTEGGQAKVTWADTHMTYITGHNEEGRGMELSELTYYNKRLYAGDDRTGLVYELSRAGVAIPRYTLMEGDGNTNKGFKVEWSTVKGDKLYVGSFGKEYTNPDGSVKNRNNLWVKVIDTQGRISHEDWTSRFEKLRTAVGTPYPGYMIHEAVEWSQHHKKWFILPRRVSTEAYDEIKDESMGSNTVLIVSEDFSDVVVRKIGKVTPTRGFSTFKFVPGTNDEVIVAIKSEENSAANSQSSFITAFDLSGKVLLQETEIQGGYKFEGIEFVDDWLAQ